jgi:hypothetical protein
MLYPRSFHNHVLCASNSALAVLLERDLRSENHQLFRIPWTKYTNSMILGVIHNRQKPLDLLMLHGPFRSGLASLWKQIMVNKTGLVSSCLSAAQNGSHCLRHDCLSLSESLTISERMLKNLTLRFWIRLDSDKAHLAFLGSFRS